MNNIINSLSDSVDICLEPSFVPLLHYSQREKELSDSIANISFMIENKKSEEQNIFWKEIFSVVKVEHEIDFEKDEERKKIQRLSRKKGKIAFFYYDAEKNTDRICIAQILQENFEKLEVFLEKYQEQLNTSTMVSKVISDDWDLHNLHL